MSASAVCTLLHWKKSFRSQYHLRRLVTTFASIKNILTTKPIGEKICAKGWVQSCRSQKQNVFVDLKDGSCADKLQILADPRILPEGVGYGCAVDIEGTLVESNHVKQPVEVIASKVRLLGPCNVQEYPFQAKERHTEEYERQFPHLRARISRFASVLRIRSSVAAALRKHFIDNGYFEVHTPIITSSDCEGAGEVFTVQSVNQSISDSVPNEQSQNVGSQHFFDKEVYLTVSSQMHLETMACALSKVFTLGPTFRAEHSRTRHHLSEFYMLEAEIAFLDNLSELMKVIETMIKFAASHVMEHQQELQKNHPTLQFDALEKVLKHPFIILPYSEAVDILQKSGVCLNIKWGMDLQKEQERYLVKYHDNIPVFVTDFPRIIKPFYMKMSHDFQTVESLDLLVADVGEICGGSMRENRIEVLEESMRTHKLNESLQWYLDLRRYGSVSHGGFGLGFDRFIQYILGISNIRDVVAFPRWTHHCPM